jgi:predicted ester cyclase
MTVEEKKALVRRFVAQVDADPIGGIEAFTAPDLVANVPGAPGPLDREAFKQFVGGFYSAFPNLRHHFENQVAEGDLVVSRLAVTGTHLADFQGLPPTGKDVTIDAIVIYRVKDDRVAEFWLQMDAARLMQQLGALPEPAPVAS